MKYVAMFVLLCSTCFAQDLTSATLNDMSDNFNGPIKYLGLVGAVPQTHQFMVGNTVKVAYAQGYSFQWMVQKTCNTYNIDFARATDRYWDCDTQAKKRAKYTAIKMRETYGVTQEVCTKTLYDYTDAITTTTTPITTTTQQLIDAGQLCIQRRKTFDEEALALFPD